MRAIASLCKVSTGRTGKGGNSSALNFAKKDKPGQDQGNTNNMMPELETYLMAQERSLGLNKTDYE